MLLAGCATEVVPESASPSADGATATTGFTAEGTAAELLGRLLTEAASLSEAIVADEGQAEIAARIDALWEAARPEVEDTAPELVADFDRAIALLHNGVERRRPADADKAYNNLAALIPKFSTA